MNAQLKGSYKGTAEIDEATGWVNRSKMDMEMSGEMKMLGNPQMPDGMTIPMTMKMVMTVEPEKAKKCEKWCKEHRSCNLELIKDAVETELE